MEGKSIEEMKVGQSARFSKTISETDIYLFAGITGDFNPVHLDEPYARTTIFGSRIAHGMLTAGLVSAVLGTQLPGPGSIYLGQKLRFLAPVRIGDTVTAKVEVSELIVKKNQARLRTTCINQEGKMVLDGEALVMPCRKDKA